MAPTALLGVILSLFFQEMFASTFLVCLMLIVTGAVLWASSLDRDLAGRFSFLLCIPAITGASVLKFDMREITEIGLTPFLIGILLALKITTGMLRSGKLYYFAPYCFMAGIVAILL